MPIKIPEGFWYKLRSSQKQYTRNPPGTPDVSALIANKPYWVSRTPMAVDKQKMLVLADWTVWSSEKRAQVKSALATLMEQGFTLYRWDNGQIIPLNGQLSWMDDKRVKMKAASVQEITKAAGIQHKLPMDAVQVLDDYWINHILSGNERPGPRVLRVSELSHLSSLRPDELDKVLKILNSAIPKLEKIIHDEFSELCNKTASLLKEKLSHIEMVSDYSRICVKYTDLNQVEGFELNNEQVKNVKTIICGPFTSIPYLQSLLTLTTQLTTLNVRECHNLLGELNIADSTFNELKSIIVGDSIISSSNVEMLLKAAPKLKSLDFLGYALLDQPMNLEAIALKELESIRLSSSNVSSYNLQQLLTSASNLKKLHLDVCKNLAGALSLNNNSLEQLSYINLDSSNISLSNLQTLLQAAPHIKKLKLSECQNLEGQLNLNHGSLDTLALIDLANSNISSFNVQTFLQAAPKIKTLSLSGCHNLKDDLNLKDGSLDELESIDARESTMSSSILKTFLQAAPHITVLELVGCQNLEDDLNLNHVNLNKLSAINLGYSTISSANLQSLLQAAPHVEVLGLIGCQHLEGELNLNPDLLDKLEFIDLTESNIPSSNLQVLLQATPNINTLCLDGCQHLDGELNLEGLCLGNLKRLRLSSTNISLPNLQALLKAAPNLEDIRLDNCSNLKGFLNLKENSLTMLKTYSLHRSHLSAQNEEVLLKAAPMLKNEGEDKKSGFQFKSVANKAPVHQAPASPLNQEPVPYVNPEPDPHVNPEHDPQQMREFKPESGPFKFKKNNNTKNQGMIIAKLSQYLTLKQKHLDIIPKIQDGICNALSHYFSACSQAEWEQFIEKAQSWDGRETSLEAGLIQHFDTLFQYIRTYQLAPQPKKQYVGDELMTLFNSKTTHIVLNPWHAITIRPADNGDWYVYDPNYVTGYQRVSQNDLQDTIHKAIGNIVSVESENTNQLLAIHNPDQFLAHGGLLALCSCENTDAIVSKLPKEHLYTTEALDGLLLRSLSGTPAWVIGFASKNPLISQWTRNLLAQFKRNHQDAEQILAKSLDALSPAQKGECITTLVQSSIQPETKALIAVIRASVNQKYYESQLKTWDKEAQPVPSALAYGHHCLSSEQKKRLIELESTVHVDSLRIQLEHLALSTHRPVFYIDKPEDLVCSAPWMKKDGALGALQKGPGGPLYDFLQANKNTNPLIIINYEAFNSDDMVRFNGLLDKEPHADGIPLPSQTMIVGLMNRNKPNCYQGSDFYSRFNKTEHCPLTTQQLDALKPSKRVKISPEGNQDKVTINLYHSPDWEDRLLGYWVLNGQSLHFIEGELTKAIKTGKPVEIQNGFWGDKSFERFWQLALTSGVRHEGQVVKIPEHIEIFRPEIDSYKWPLIPQINEAGAANQEFQVLNPTRLIDFMEPYELQGDQLVKTPGLIERAKGNPKPLAVYVTRTMKEDSWAMVMDECARHGVQLEVHCAPGVELPEAFHYQVIPPVLQQGVPKNVQEDVFIASTDIDTTVAQLIKDKEYLVIDVSECTAADLLTKLDGQLNQNTLKFEFSQSDSALKNALKENKNLILKGKCSAELLDLLAPLLQDRKSNKAGGQIVLVTDDVHAGTFISHGYQHQVTKEEKLECLPAEPALIDKLASYAELESLSKLRARYHFLKANPKAAKSDDAWLGLQSLEGSTQASVALLDKATSLSESNEFTQNRRAKVNTVLHSAPYVFLSGLSGVGKSTFVEQELCTANDTLYLTEERIQSWAEDTSDKRKILFLDEANLSPRQWSEFEGLFNRPPSILVNGTFYTLSPNHKVVFAGNPVNYGDERSLAPLFQRHGNAVLFTPLSPAVIYEKILKPVFSNTGVVPEPFVDPILAVYRFICECSTTEVLISPRELQMMALLSITHAQKHPEHHLNDIAEHFSYELAKNLVPQDKMQEFNIRFQPKNPIKTVVAKAEQDQSFLLTESRQAISQQLNDLLGLREWRRAKENELNKAQKAGGLGGIIIEGEPGIGKSELVMAELRARNYTEEHDLEHPTTMEKPFYRLHVSMAQDEKEKLLIKAFNEGAVVLIDEINSSTMMERLLNDLLMGKNPRGQEGEQVKPGFMVIGTQNPVTMSGRRAPSTALQRRLITTTLPEYTAAEIKTILLAKGVEAPEVESMIASYEQNRAFALSNQLSPAPNFRNLMHLVEDYLHNRKEAPMAPSAANEHHDAVEIHSRYKEKMHEMRGAYLPEEDNQPRPGNG